MSSFQAGNRFYSRQVMPPRKLFAPEASSPPRVRTPKKASPRKILNNHKLLIVNY